MYYIRNYEGSCETGIDLVTELANSIVSEDTVPLDWEVSSIVIS